MGKGKEIFICVQEAIIREVNLGMKRNPVAEHFNVHSSTITRNYKRYAKNRSISKVKRFGRPRKTTECDDKMILRASRNDPRLTSVDIQ